MSKSQFKWDYEAAGNLFLRSKEISNICEAEAQKMTRATGMDYIPDVRVGRTRVMAGGYSESHDGKSGICPKCGHSHPNCDCTT